MAIKPVYVSTELWDQMAAKKLPNGTTVQDYLADEKNKAKVIAKYGDATPQDVELPDAEPELPEASETLTRDDVFDMIRIDTDKPSDIRRKSDELAKLVNDADRKAVQAVFQKHLDFKVESVRLVLVADRAFGPGCSKLPRHGVAQGTGNDQSLSDYDAYKWKPKGKSVKDFRDGSVIEDTIIKALVTKELRDEIEKLEKYKGALALKNGAKPPPDLAAPLSLLREQQRVIVNRFLDVVVLSQNMALINKMEKVGCDWLNVDSSKGVKPDMSDLNRANECIMVYSKKDGQPSGMAVALSPTTIRGLRPWYAETQENGGNLKELIESKEIAPPRNTLAEAMDISKWEFEQFELAFGAVVEYARQFIGPKATKNAATKFYEFLKSDKGSEVRAFMFEFVGDAEESVTSKNELKSLYNMHKSATEKSMGGEANRQVKTAA